MPYKDAAKEMAVNYESKKKIYHPLIGIRIRKDDGTVYDSMLDAAAMRGISVQAYIRQAIVEKLERDEEMR